MTIVSVTAPANGSGKTTAVAAMAAAFPGRWAAVKFTTVYKDGVHCPRSQGSCACRELKGAFTIVDDPRTLLAAGTDTGRLAGAGAVPVLWCLARPGAHAEAWRRLRSERLGPCAAILTEGNAIVREISPDLLVAVVSPAAPRERWKADSWDLIRRAGVVVVNSHGGDAAGLEGIVRDVAAARGGLRPPVADLTRPMTEWDGGRLARRLAALLG
ncbi:MAG TPA: hypothetical protein VJV23_02090 [Candidatus Polarisedimenticolia bacterium]|nr:hypothetical protein [Candidatus Polarisedimenticolia bacterium]